MKCVLSVKESNFNEKKIQIFTFGNGQGGGGRPPPPLTVDLTIKFALFWTSRQKGSRKKRAYYGQADRRVGEEESTLSALTVSKCENVDQFLQRSCSSSRNSLRGLYPSIHYPATPLHFLSQSPIKPCSLFPMVF